MRCKISNDKTTIIIDNFESLKEAQNCFPNRTVIETKEMHDYSSFNDYVKAIMYVIPNKYHSKDDFVERFRKISSNVDIKIAFDETNSTIIMYLPNNAYLEYEYYIDNFGDFSIGDFITDDVY